MTKRRGNHEGTVVRRRDGRWAAAISLPDGRRRWFYAKTQAAVVDRMQAAQRAVADGKPVAPERETVGTFLRRWLDDSARPTIRPSTYDQYDWMVRRYLIPQIGRHRLSRLTPDLISAMYRELGDGGLSPRSVRLAHAVLHRALSRAERWGLVGRNPASLVDPPRSPRSKIQSLTPEQITALLRAAKDDRLEALYVLAVASGLRQGELLGLPWKDVDLERRTVQVRQQLQRRQGEWEFVEPKSASSIRTVTIPDVAVEALRRHRVRQAEGRLSVGPAWTDHGLVFTTPVGTPIDKRNLLRRSFEPLLERAGLPRIRFHDLRHSAATLLLVQGVHPKVVQERLGHSSIRETMDTYSHVLPSLQEEAAKRLDEVLAPSRGLGRAAPEGWPRSPKRPGRGA